MNIQQFQYVLALAEYRHFETAAEKCFITQSTLSTMVSKFEDELGIQIFDRKKKPLGLTSEGAVLLEQIRRIRREIDALEELSQEIKGEIGGSLSIAVIPTVAPFLLPLFLHRFAKAFPKLLIDVREQTTAEIIRNLHSRDLDIGIVSIPLQDALLQEHHLYDEAFVYFDMQQQEPGLIAPQHIDPRQLCLLEEGHCMRTQIVELCKYYENKLSEQLNFRFRAGSIDSLLRFVRANAGATLLPELAVLDLSAEEKQRISLFESPRPYRSIGLVVHQHFVKRKLLELLLKDIRSAVLPLLSEQELLGKQLLPLKGKK